MMTLNATHLARGDNLRTVRPEHRASAVAAIELLQQIEFDESYWLRMVAPKDDDANPRR